MKAFLLLQFITLAFAISQNGELRKRRSPAQVELLSQESDVSPDGKFHYSFEESDGTKVSADGYLKHIDEKNAGVAVQGQYEYVGDDGKVYSVNYVADETGYHPEGDHIPEIPPFVIKALEWAAEHPYKEQSRGLSFDR